MPGTQLGGVTFDAHTLLFASLAILCGYQSISVRGLYKTFAIAEGLMPEDRAISRGFSRLVNLERGLLLRRGAADGLGALARQP